jgi:hypothetical protein
VLRDFWREALYALQNAENIYFLGYSVPPQDQAAMGLIIEGISERQLPIKIVDIHPESVMDNLSNLLLPPEKGGTESGEKERLKEERRTQFTTRYAVTQYPIDPSCSVDNVIGHFSSWYSAEVQPETADKLRDLDKMMLSLSRDDATRPLPIRQVNVQVSLRECPSCQLCPKHSQLEDGDGTLAMRLDSCSSELIAEHAQALVEKMASDKMRRIVVRCRDGADTDHDYPVVGYRIKELRYPPVHIPLGQQLLNNSRVITLFVFALPEAQASYRASLEIPLSLNDN